MGDDTHRVRRIGPSGVTTTIAGTGQFGDIEGTGDEATFYYPTGMTVDAAGSLYVVTGGQYQFDGGGSSTSPGLRIRFIERIFAVGNP